MSKIIGVDGNPLDMAKLSKKPNRYAVGEVQIISTETPNDRLNTALQGARQMAVAQVAQQLMVKGVSQEDAVVRGNAEASKIASPFQMEPAAEAVFMLLSQEISKRDEQISELHRKLEKIQSAIGADPEDSSPEAAGVE